MSGTFLTQYGAITGTLPLTAGRTFFVAPAAAYTVNGRGCGASDGNDGLSPYRALLTVAEALNKCTAGNGDTIFLLPGAHTATASLAFSKAMVKLTAVPGNFVRPPTSLTTSAADEIINATAADVEIANLRLIVVTAQTGLDWTTAAHRLYVHDCSFDMTATASTSTVGLGHPGTTYTAAPVHVLIQHNYFEVNGAQGPAIKVGDAQDFVIERNVWALKSGTWAQVTLQGGVLGWGCYRDNEMVLYKNGAITAGITGTDLTSTLSVAILRNFFGGGATANAKPIEDWGATDAYIAENYMTAVGAAAGGALWSSIT